MNPPVESPDKAPTTPAGFKSGYVAILGRPNVGKSTLLNTILGQKVAIVTPKPQTTRNRIVGVKNLPQAQIVFLDTPGIHNPKQKLGEFMVREAIRTLKEVDIALVMVEPHRPHTPEVKLIESIKASKERHNFVAILAINKIDRVKKAELLPVIDIYQRMMDFEEIIPISALKGDGIDRLIELIIRYLPEGPKYYPDEIITDQLERFMVSEIIREKVMLLTREEVPYSVAVEVLTWQDKEDITVISANIYVEKDSQKGIIIGSRGQRLKDIGRRAREEIEALLGTRVYLELWVKVKEDWRDRVASLKDLGYY